MNTADILTEKLQLFINELRIAGYNIGLTQFVAAQNLILALAKQGELPPKLASLKTLLAPVLCHSPKEQAEFGRRFDNWVKQVEASEDVRGPAKDVILEEPAPKTVRRPSKLKKWAYFGIGTLLMLIASLVFYQFMFTEPETPPIKTPSTPDSPSASPKQADAPTPLADEKPDDFSVDTITLLESPVNFFGMLLPLLALIFILVWYLWKKARDALTQFYLKRALSSRRPELQGLSVKASRLEKSIFQPISLSRTAQQLRKHSAIEDNTLDITATLEKTIEAGGWPTPVYGSRPHLPEYLVLIDRTTFKDHQAKLVNTLINQLVKEGMLITRSYFDGNPRLCYLESESDPFVPLTLSELAERYPDHRLLIFSEGQGLINAVTGELVNWIEQFAVWTHRILLTLEAPAQWGYRKALLEEADFLVLPANEAGLQWLVEQLNVETPESYRTDSEADSAEFPPFLRDYPRRWLERHAPEPTELLALLKQVRFFLGKAGYYWFSACAVYPELHWELTLYLGEKLTSDGKKLLTEEHLAKLARLPWFRSGYMPEWLRERLVEELLAAEKDRAIRDAINEFLQPKPEDVSKTAQMEVALGRPSIDEGEALREYVFVKFMAKAKESTFKLPHLLSELFRSQISAISGRISPVFHKNIPLPKLKLQKFPKIPLPKLKLQKFPILILPFLFLSLVIFGFFWLYQFVQAQNIFISTLSPMKSLLLAIIMLFILVWFFQQLFWWLISIILPTRIFCEKYRHLCVFTSNIFIGLIIFFLGTIYSPLIMNFEDIILDFAMQVLQEEIPAAKPKQIPPFVFLDIDNQTHQRWNDPLVTPRNKLKELIEVAVKGEARLVIMDIDVSRNMPIEGVPVGVLEQHPYDQALYDYIANYKKYCERTNCPVIVLARVFRPLPSFDDKQKNSANWFRPDKEPIYESRISFLEEAVVKSAPYVQWASPLFLASAYDKVIRYSLLWKGICTAKKPEVIPSIQLLTAAMIRHDTPQQAQLSINNALAQLKPKSCNSDNYMPQSVSSKPIKIVEGLEISDGLFGIRQRIMYKMPWLPPTNSSEKWTVRYFLLDYDKKTQERNTILTVYSAQSYLDSAVYANAAGALKDKIVLIGGSYTDGGDLHYTPLDDMPGGLIIINAIHSLLQYGEIKSLSFWDKLKGTILVIFFVSILFLFIGHSFWWIIFTATITIVSMPVSVFLLGEGIWINFTFPLLAVYINQMSSTYHHLEISLSQAELPNFAREKLISEIEESLKASLNQQIYDLINQLPGVMEESQRWVAKLTAINVPEEKASKRRATQSTEAD
jgi:CHASE2 domain-containing sensor protein